jgi:hypothetical protein
MFNSFNIGGGDSLLRDVHTDVLQFFQGLFLTIVGWLMLVLAGRRLFPEDLFSTARFFDALTIAKVFDTPASLADDRLLSFLMNQLMAFDFPNVSVSAITVALVLALTQIVCGYLITANKKPYTNNSKNGWALAYNLLRGHDSLIGNASANWYRIGYASLYVFCVLADTFTDIVFRASVGEGFDPFVVLMQSVFVSVVVYNLLSEWAIIQGFALLINNGYSVITRAIPVTSLVVGEIRNGLDRAGMHTQTRSPRNGGGKKAPRGSGNGNGNGNGGKKRPPKRQAPHVTYHEPDQGHGRGGLR